MRILLASDFYWPFLGGLEHQVRMLGRELTRRGHEVAMATVWHRGLVAVEDDQGVAIHRLRGLTTSVPWFYRNPGNYRFHPPFPDPAIVWRLRRLLNEFKPDVVHATGWISYSCAAALLGRSTPLIVSVRDYGYACATRTLMYQGEVCDGPAILKCLGCANEAYGPAKALVAVAGVLGGRALFRRKVTATASVSTFVHSTVLRDIYGADRAGDPPIGVVMPNIVPQSVLDSAGGSSSSATPIDEAIVQEHLARLPTEPFILYVGELRPHKGIGPLLAAYQQLSNPPPLVMIGMVWPESPKEYPPGVTVLKNIPHRAVMAAWERCLFGVVPSIWPEPLGNVVREAMICGKAVVAAASGGIVDMVDHGTTGLLVKPGDATALAAAMRLLLQDEPLRERLGRAGREQSRRFGPDQVVPRFEALYRDVTRLAASASR